MFGCLGVRWSSLIRCLGVWVACVVIRVWVFRCPNLRLYVYQALNALIRVSPNALIRVSPNASNKSDGARFAHLPLLASLARFLTG